MSNPKQSGEQLMKGTISTVLFVCLLLCLKENVSPLISICSHITHGFKGEKNNIIFMWVMVRLPKKISAV